MFLSFFLSFFLGMFRLIGTYLRGEWIPPYYVYTSLPVSPYVVH